MGAPTGEQVAIFYAAAHQRLSALVEGLTEEQAATPVSATPGWSVHDVLAHLAAIPTDGLAGRLDGIPNEQFTAGQVAERRDRSAAELLEEWAANVGTMCDLARVDLVPQELAVDALTHEQDIRGALGLPSAIESEELRFCTRRYASGCGGAIRSAGLPTLGIEATDSDFAAVAGDGEPGATVRAPEFEFFRALSGRRSRDQVAQFDWDGESAPYLDAFCIFGPLREQDLHEV
jgi:uncharacterized protein (TIGR03083 family)